MRRKKHFISSIILSLILVMSFALPAFAADKNASEVSFGKTFTFNPSSGDLFTNLKDLMPGDSRIQYIKLSNTTTDKAKFYLKLNGKTEDKTIGEAIQIVLRDTDGKTIYTGALTNENEPLLLGEIPANSASEISLDLFIDEKLSNEYQGYVGSTKWTFIVEQNEKKQEIVVNDNEVPLGGLENLTFPLGELISTADPTDLALWTGITIAGSIGVAFTIVRKRKLEKE